MGANAIDNAGGDPPRDALQRRRRQESSKPASLTDDESDGVRCSPESFLPGGGGTPFGGTYVPASAVPEPARFPFQGYGEVNHASIDTAIALLRGEVEPPMRASDDAAYQQARERKMRVVGDAE